MTDFEAIYQKYLKEQKNEAEPRRLEMLERELIGTKLEMEHRITNSSGVSLFIDVYHERLRLGFECEGFSAHAETITRERFTFEKSKVRTMLEARVSFQHG